MTNDNSFELLLFWGQVLLDYDFIEKLQHWNELRFWWKSIYKVFLLFVSWSTSFFALATSRSDSTISQFFNERSLELVTGNRQYSLRTSRAPRSALRAWRNLFESDDESEEINNCFDFESEICLIHLSLCGLWFNYLPIFKDLTELLFKQ